MSVASSVIERNTYLQQPAQTEAAGVDADRLHNSRMRNNLARLLDPANTTQDVVASIDAEGTNVIRTTPVEVEPEEPRSAHDMLYGPRRATKATVTRGIVAQNTQAERQPVFMVTNARADADIFRADNPINAIGSRKITEENDGSLAQVDAGSGAFQLEDWDVGSSVTLKAYDGYWEEGLPVSDGVTFRTISDETSCATAIRNGEVDMILDATSTVTAVLQNASGLTITSIPGTFWEYLGMNCEHEYLDDPLVRRAIACAIDRDAINAAVKLGSATVLTNTCIPNTHEAGLTTDTYPARDVEKAAELLEQAGIQQGEITLDMKVGSDWQYQVDAGTMIKQQLADVGINVEITAEDSGIFFDDLNSGNFDLTICGWSGFVDADEYLYNLFTSDGSYNQQNYSNPQVDELLHQARITMDNDERIELYRQAEQIIADDAPMAFLYMNNYTVITRDNITGFTPLSTGNAIFLKETSK